MIVGLLLAAGDSRRFGSDKRQHPLGNGSSVLEQSFLGLKPHCDVIVVVLPADTYKGSDTAQRMSHQTALLCFVDNPTPIGHKGLGYSIALGAKFSMQTIQMPIDGFMIALADMPFIQSTTYEYLLTVIKDKLALNNPFICAPEHQNRQGHPVFFSRHFAEDLMALTGDAGASPVVKNNRQYMQTVAVDDEGIFKDIDTPQDLI